MDIQTGEISLTCNYRPIKALKYVKEEDSVFGAAQVGMAALYPGEGNRRVRWEHASIGEVRAEDLGAVRSLAARSLAAEAKAAKNYLKSCTRRISFLQLPSSSSSESFQMPPSSS